MQTIPLQRKLEMKPWWLQSKIGKISGMVLYESSCSLLVWDLDNAEVTVAHRIICRVHLLRNELETKRC